MVTSVLANQVPVLAKVCRKIAENLILPIAKGSKPKKICAMLPRYDIWDASLEYLAQAQEDDPDEAGEQNASINIEDLDDAESPIQTSLLAKSQDPQHRARSPSPTNASEASHDRQSIPQRSLMAASDKSSLPKANIESNHDVMTPPIQLPSGKILPSSSRSGSGSRRKSFAPLPSNPIGIECLLASVKDDSLSLRVSPKATPSTKATFTAEVDKGAEAALASKPTLATAQDGDDEEACQIRLIEHPDDDNMFVPERKRHKLARKDSLTTPQMSSINGPDLFRRSNSSGKRGKAATQLRGRKGLDALKNLNHSQSMAKQSIPTQYDIWKNIDIPKSTVQCSSPILTTPEQPSKKSNELRSSAPHQKTKSTRRRRLIEEDSDDGFIVHDEDEEKLQETYEAEKHEPNASTPSRSEAVELSSDDDVAITGSTTRTLLTRSAMRNLTTYGGVVVDTSPAPTLGVSKKTVIDISSADDTTSSGDTSDEEGDYDNKKAGLAKAFGGRFV